MSAPRPSESAETWAHEVNLDDRLERILGRAFDGREEIACRRVSERTLFEERGGRTGGAADDKVDALELLDAFVHGHLERFGLADVPRGVAAPTARLFGQVGGGLFEDVLPSPDDERVGAV